MSAAPSSRRLFPLAVLLLGVAALLFFSSGQPGAPTQSVEVQFADESKSGLSIVPASCPSYPHYGGQCTPASCSIWFSPNPVAAPDGSYLYWTSSNAHHWVYISDVGYVGASGQVWVSPSQTTTYGCQADGEGGSDGYHYATLTVYRQCSLPWGGSIQHGQSVTAYQAPSVSYGQNCVSQTRSCSDGSLSGSYQYSSCSADPPASCTLDGVTVAHGDSRTFYDVATAPQGELCSSHAQSRTCTNGTFSGSSSYDQANCSCTPSTVYSCSPENVVRTVTDSSCGVAVTNPHAVCTPPAFCSAGSAVCLYPPPSFGANGHLTAIPSILLEGETTQMHWDVDNVSSCSVTAFPTNGVSWSGASAGCDGERCYAGASGKTSGPINSPTVFALSCEGLDGSSVYEEETVTINPLFEEI